MCSDFIYSRVHQGLGPGIPRRAAVGGGSGLIRKRSLSPFRRLAPQVRGGRPLLSSPAGDSSSSSSSSSSEAERALEPSDIVSEVPRRRSPHWVFLASFSAFFFGALGAGTNIFIKSGLAGSSGNGAGQWIHPAFFVQP